MGKKISDADEKLKKLKKLYGYEIATYQQQTGDSLRAQEDLKESLAIVHLERQLQDAVTEYMELMGSGKESYAYLFSTLTLIQMMLEERFPGLTIEDKTLAESTAKEWAAALREQRK